MGTNKVCWIELKWPSTLSSLVQHRLPLNSSTMWRETGGPVLPVLCYAQARSMYAPLEMTDGVDSCWQALNMHTQKRTRAHTLPGADTDGVPCTHKLTPREHWPASTIEKRWPSSLAWLAVVLVYITDCIQQWTESLWRQQLFSKCNSWASGPF